jgi:DNA phosphorothioation-dependent restriction protein DptG
VAVENSYGSDYYSDWTKVCMDIRDNYGPTGIACVYKIFMEFTCDSEKYMVKDLKVIKCGNCEGNEHI